MLRSFVKSWSFLSISAILCAISPVSVEAQEGSSRYPATGNAILNCAPEQPVPSESCVLRLPPEYERGTPQSEKIGEIEGEFQLLRSGRPGFPDGLEMSATLLLVDLTPGQGGGRRATFDRERELMQAFLQSIPAGEPVAIYSFADSVGLQLDFTTDKAALAKTVDEMELSGANTNITASVREAIRVMQTRDNVILKNVVLVTDGVEEGIGQFDEVTAEAVDAGVLISAIDMFWRPVGAAQNGRGIDFLRSLTQGTLGTTAQVSLTRLEQAREAVDIFAGKFANSIERSGLILPTGTPQPSVISLVLTEPVVGDVTRKQEREIEVTFTPARETTDTDPEDTVTEVIPEDLIFGYPRKTIYITLGALLGLIVLAALFVALRGRKADVGEEPTDFDDSPVVQTMSKPPAQAAAFLKFNAGQRREPISSAKVNIGRSASNEIVIEDESISRLHAQLHRNRDGGFSVTDMDSLNGTYVNDTKVAGTVPLQTGDVIRFGKVNSTFATS